MADEPPSPGPAERLALSVVLPAFDEVEALPPLVDEIERALGALDLAWEMVLVDDGSADGTTEWIAEAARRRPRVVGVFLERNSGQSAALAAGFQVARGALLATLDADGQNDPADIPRLLAVLGDADVVSGIRSRRADPLVRRISSRIANAVRRAAIGDRITDIGCSMKLYRREAIAGLPLFTGAHRFLPALCQFRGSRVVELPVAHRPRRHGRSKYGVSNRLFRGIRDLWGVAWLRSRLLHHRVREVVRHVV